MDEPALQKTSRAMSPATEGFSAMTSFLDMESWEVDEPALQKIVAGDINGSAQVLGDDEVPCRDQFGRCSDYTPHPKSAA